MRLRHPTSLGGAAALTLASAVTTGLVAAAAAPATASDGATFAGETTTLRASYGLAPYRECPDLDAVAAGWAQHEAGAHTLEHNPALGTAVTGWSVVGENVGEGGSAPLVQAAFVRSPPHLGNLLSTAFSEVGYGTARSADGVLWVDEVFRRPAGAACAAAADVVPRPAAAPATKAAVPPASSRSETRTAIPTAAQCAAAVAAARGRLLATRRAAFATRLRTAHGAQDVVGDALAFARLMGAVR